MPLYGEEKRVYQLNWITARKKKYIEQMGCCYFCGSHEKIEIHHLDPAKKNTHKIWSYSEDKIEAELRMCVALCNSCHTKFHQLIRRRSEHGTATAYRHGCRCGECRAAKAEEDRARKLKH